MTQQERQQSDPLGDKLLDKPEAGSMKTEESDKEIVVDAEEPGFMVEQAAAAAAAENESTTSSKSSAVTTAAGGGGSRRGSDSGGGYAADCSASDFADDDNNNNVQLDHGNRGTSFKLSVECFRQHHHPHHHNGDARTSHSSIKHSPSRDHHHNSRRKRHWKKQSTNSHDISSADAAAVAAAAAFDGPQQLQLWDMAAHLAVDNNHNNHMNHSSSNTDSQRDQQRQAIEIYLANGATSIDSHIELMGLVSAYYDVNDGGMPPVFSQQPQQPHQQLEAGAAAAESLLNPQEQQQPQQESSEGFTAFFTTTHSSAETSTGTGTSESSQSPREEKKKRERRDSDDDEEAEQSATKRRTTADAAPDSSSSLSSSELSQTSKTQRTTHRSDDRRGLCSSNSYFPGGVASGTLFNKSIALLPRGAVANSTAVRLHAAFHPQQPGKKITSSSGSSSDTGAQNEASQHLLDRTNERKPCKLSTSNAEGGTPLVPGQPVTLDQVLRFCNSPRLIVKAFPPFRVVHANAAFYRFTGGGNDNVVGAAVSSLLSLPNNGDQSPQTIRQDDTAANHGVSATMSGIKHPLVFQAPQVDPRVVCLERLVVAGGFGRCHLIQVTCPAMAMKMGETNKDVVDDDKRTSKDVGAVVAVFSATIAPVASDMHVMEQRKQQQQYQSLSLLAAGTSNMSNGNQFQPPTTHYVIQLEPIVEQQVDSVIASGSTSRATTTGSPSAVKDGHAPTSLRLSKEELDRLPQPPVVMIPIYGTPDGGVDSSFPHHIAHA